MTTAIFSDIHANLTALDAVLADAKAHGADNFACLGDLVGYGPNPSECVTLVQKVGCVCVKGNHDEDSSNQRVLDNLNSEARESLEWTRTALSDAQKTWLAELPYQRRLGRNLLVHAAQEDPASWPYIRNRFDAQIALSKQSASICFFGHTHVPTAYCLSGGDVTAIPQGDISLDSNNKYLVNVGSVGQPRDGIADACYVLYNRENLTISYRRVSYDVDQVVDQINQVGLSPSLGERLKEAA